MIIKAILETLGVCLLACLFAWLGCRITQKKSKTWIVSFFMTFPFILFIILMNRTPILFYQSGLSRLAEGRNEYIMMAVCMPFLFGLLIPRLPVQRQKIVIGIFAFLGTAYFSLPPFLDPVLLHAQMKDTET